MQLKQKQKPNNNHTVIDLKRSLNYQTSLSPKYFYQILGKRAKRNIQIDEKILFSKLKK